METLEKYMNNECGRQITPYEYKNFACIHGHKFEGDETSNGWISFKLELTTPYKTPHSLVIWYVYDTEVTIDKYNRLEKEIL